MTGSTVPLGEYLWRRIASIGIEHVFGVPGDFNLALLDHLYARPKMTWLGTCNELNGAYAADGYARIKGHPAALLLTYAVGELSALNGVTGAYAEHAGMINIVGMTARPAQKARLMVHHTMEKNMDHAVYISMSKPVRKTHAFLVEDATMAEEIDRVIIECVTSRLPVYIYIPTDVVDVSLDASRLDVPLNTSIENKDKKLEAAVVEKVLDLIKQATKPCILVDVLAIRHGGADLSRRLVEITKFQSFSTPASKGVIDEQSPTYSGVYNGKVSFDGVAEALHSSDLVINIGPLLSDSTTGGFSREISDEHLVSLAHNHCQVRNEMFDGMHFLPVLKGIVDALEKHSQLYSVPRSLSWKKLEPPLLNNSTSGVIEQSFLWQRLGRFFKPDDTVLVDAGTAQFGIPDAVFPNNTTYITSVFWASIGYSVGACLGACVAAKELQKPGRIILIVGEGALQMTVQEIGTYIRNGFKPIIFVINNDGYAIERAINGPTESYNDVSMLWDHQILLKFFGRGVKSESFECKTVEKLETVLQDKDFVKADYIQLCEIFTGKFDYPWRLSTQINSGRKAQSTLPVVESSVTG